MTDTVKCIIKYKKEVMAEDAIILSGGTIDRTLHSISAVVATIPQDKVEELKKNPNIEYVEVTTPEDVHVLGFKSDLGIEEMIETLQASQQIPWGITKIRATDVQNGGNKGTGIRVCILDTGMDYNHEDLIGQMKLGYNFVSGTNDPYDDYGHGTHVAGTIAALDNTTGVIGVAPECSLLIGKVLDKNGSGSYDNIVAGIQWAINNNAQIISMSFGGGGFSQALKDICDAAKKAGVVLVAAAGNADGDGNQDTVGYPAKYDSVIAVASTDSNDKRSSFSSAGSEVWVAAPGSNVLSTVPKRTCALCDPSGYKYLNGTSMATPHVSAVVALMLKANPNLSPDNVRTLLSTTSIDLGTSGRDVFFGYGRIDAANAVGEHPTPTKTYNCTGAPDFQCIEAPSGTTGKYPDLASCQAACKAPQPTPVLTSIALSPASTTVNVGKTTPLTSVCKDQNNNTITCPSLVWETTNNAAATVDNNGIVTGISEGVAGVTASLSDIHSNVSTITVVSAPPSKNKYMVIQSGTMNIVVVKNRIGKYTADEACTQVCNTLKQIDKTEN